MIIYLDKVTSDFLIKCLDENSQVVYTPNTELRQLVIIAYPYDNGVRLTTKYQSRPVYPEDLTPSFIENFRKECEELYNNRDIRTLKEKIKEDEKINR